MTVFVENPLTKPVSLINIYNFFFLYRTTVQNTVVKFGLKKNNNNHLV